MIRAAVTHPVATFTAVGALVAVGVFSLLHLPVSLLPRLERPVARISIESHGSSREHLLEHVVEPLEPRLLSIEGAIGVRSLVVDGRAVLHLQSDWFVDPDQLLIDVDRRLSNLGNDPTLQYTVELRPADRSPAVAVVVTGADASARTAFVQHLLVPELGSLQGVARVEPVGLSPRHVVVRPNGAQLTAHEMTAADLLDRLRSVGVPLPVGKARRGARVSPLVVEQAVESLGELRRLPLGGPGGPELGDVAKVDLETVATGSFARMDGEDAVLLRIYRAQGSNGIALVARVRRTIEQLDGREHRFHLGVVDDRSSEIIEALELLGLAALIGLVAGALVLRLLLGTWRHALALAAIVPGAGLASFVAFYVSNLSLNLISLSGLGLAVGLLVDSAIVVVEAIESARAAGEEEPAVRGTQRVAGAVVAAFLTTAVVFLPLIYLTGLARAFFGIQAFAIVTSLLFALLLSLTLTPVLNRGSRRAARAGAPGLAGYRRALDWAVEHPAAVSIAALTLVAAGVVVVLALPRELMPAGTAREVDVAYNLPSSLDNRQQEALGKRLARLVARTATPFQPRSVLDAQAPVDPLAEPDRPAGEMLLRFADPRTARRALSRLQRPDVALAGVPVDARLRSTALQEAARWAGGRYEVLASAETREATARLEGRVRALLQEIPGVRVSEPPTSRSQTALRMELDPLATGLIEPEDLRRQISAGLGDEDAGWVEMPGVEPGIVLAPTETPGLTLLPVVGRGQAGVVPAGAWTRLVGSARQEVADRQDGRWTARIPVGRMSEAARRSLERKLGSLSEPQGETVHLGGEAWELQRSFRQLSLLLALSLLLVFLTVTALYESVAVSAVVLATIPPGLAGALLLLAATGQTLNVMSFLGLVLLAGMVVNNSIVLVHRAEQLRKEGEELGDAVRDAAAERYRPILMTTLTTLVGMIPLAALGGQGVELRRALSLAVVGGLATSTLASLLLVPALYRSVRRRTSSPVAE